MDTKNTPPPKKPHTRFVLFLWRTLYNTFVHMSVPTGLCVLVYSIHISVPLCFHVFVSMCLCVSIYFCESGRKALYMCLCAHVHVCGLVYVCFMYYFYPIQDMPELLQR